MLRLQTSDSTLLRGCQTDEVDGDSCHKDILLSSLAAKDLQKQALYDVRDGTFAFGRNAKRGSKKHRKRTYGYVEDVLLRNASRSPKAEGPEGRSYREVMSRLPLCVNARLLQDVTTFSLGIVPRRNGYCEEAELLTKRHFLNEMRSVGARVTGSALIGAVRMTCGETQAVRQKRVFTSE